MLIAASVSLAIFALHPQRRPLQPRVEVLAERTAESMNSHLQDVELTAADGVLLRGWFVHSKKQNGDVVILLHGVGDNRTGMAGYAKFLLQHGYSVLLPDSRAHGMSGGTVATY